MEIGVGRIGNDLWERQRDEGVLADDGNRRGVPTIEIPTRRGGFGTGFITQ